MRRLAWVVLLLVAADARAQTDAPAAPEARRAADDGVFSTWTMAPRAHSRVLLQGGYDAARGEPTFDSIVEAALTGRLAFSAGASYAETWRPRLGARLDALRQADAGIDLAVSAGYEPHGLLQRELRTRPLLRAPDTARRYCAHDCRDDRDCPGDMRCHAGACAYPAPSPGALGAACASASECDSRFCTAQTCSKLCLSADR